MDQRLSRPARWRNAVNRATNALGNLRDLHGQWATKLEGLREELEALCAHRTSASKDLRTAISDLIELQWEYDCWRSTIPESLEYSPSAEKLDDVQNVNFNRLQGNVSDLTKFALEDALEDAVEDTFDNPLHESFMEALATLHEAKEFDLPKGYGRD
jgi:hypothetical protein